MTYWGAPLDRRLILIALSSITKKGVCNQFCRHLFSTYFVGVTGFEPATTWSQTRCATGLRYAPRTFAETENVHPNIPSPLKTLQSYIFFCNIATERSIYNKIYQIFRSNILPRQCAQRRTHTYYMLHGHRRSINYTPTHTGSYGIEIRPR